MSFKDILYLHKVDLPVLDLNNVYNLDFLDGLTYWIFIKHTDAVPKVDYVEEVGIVIKSVKDARWTLVYKPLIKIKENNYYVVEAYVKYCFTSNRFNPKKGEVDGFVIRVELLDGNSNPIELSFDKWVWGDNGEAFYRTDWRCGYKPCINLGRFRCGDIALAGCNDWKNVFSFFKIPKSSKYMRIHIVGQGEGIVYIKV